MTLTELDVLTLEDSLKSFMRSQPLFKDYDFEGSNMSALIRILALNTWKNSWYLHMVHSEGFLDSAQIRSSVLSHAKELNYTPRSARSAKGRVSVTFSGTEPSYVIEKGKTFSSTVKNRGIVFSVPETVMLTSSNGSFSFTTDLYEGRYVKDSYVINHADETQRLLITNPDVDTRSLTVVVYEDGVVAGDTYSKSTTMLDVNETSKVFFLQASESGQYEVVFGDGVVGRRPADGAVVVFDYRISIGEAGNGARIFNRDFEIGSGVSNVKVETVTTSSGGAPAESVESIRYYAPRHFQTQERAVTASDFAVMLKTQFPEILAVSAYGGEDASPPMYGKVIVALDVEDVDGIPEAKKDEYGEFLRRRCGLTIEPVFVEPEYAYLSITSKVLYNLNLTTVTPENMKTIIMADVLAYAEDNLNDFESTMRYSRLVGTIDAAHPSVVSNQTEVLVYKKVSVEKGASSSFVVDFAFPLRQDYPQSPRTFPIGDKTTVRSGRFSSVGESRYVVDDGAGSLWVATDRGENTVLVQKCGTVDYDSGVVRVNGLSVDDYQGTAINFYVELDQLDVKSERDTILTLEPSAVSLVVTPVRE